MDNYVMFTLSKSPEKNWIDTGQVRQFFIIKILFSMILKDSAIDSDVFGGIFYCILFSTARLN